MTFALIGMFVITLALVGAALYMVSGASWFAGSTGVLRAYVQAEPVSAVGQEMLIVVTVQNDTSEFLTIDEIRLPRPLLKSASVASIIPGTLSHQDYEGETGYEIGFLIAPGEQRQFEILLVPSRVDDVVGDIAVIAGKYQARTGFRVRLEEAVAIVVPTSTLPLPTQTPEPTWTPVPLIPTPTPVVIPYNGVVKLTAKVKYSSYLKPLWSGSATVISVDGLLLTNAHLVSPGQGFRPDIWVVSITTSPDLPPEDMYYAEPLVVDEDLDIAVMRIVSDLKYKPVQAEDLHLQVVPLGDSTLLSLGDALFIMGYPGIGGESITLTSGSVGGFTASNKYGERSFIKTSATISGGTSGGLVMDDRGYIVAIPTQLGYGGRDEANLVDCRVVTDTNRDGNIDNRDACIPVGGFINAMRPIHLAIPLIEQARAILAAELLGTPVVTLTPTP